MLRGLLQVSLEQQLDGRYKKKIWTSKKIKNIVPVVSCGPVLNAHLISNSLISETFMQYKAVYNLVM